ncbi:hypothetical protein PsAD2_01415 [Pseudovibrio axinellae]|uniref:Uncharacterized protein n=1 Tax=Pseudovibrio axinellae TaxID=989403 RepID=A0A166A0C0_9HYPH|nr:DUF523 domain-containing protein [Pseudovibrio axinellae]KZL20484.1 hypothetical protein PsAD2_01415 [Pseudovibrio axinellae]SEQ37168.1 Uncharacterized conserved protein YbbK, DUF523 family [Pseudovibrio axinellae]
MTKILISACLLGRPVRYNGSSLSVESSLVSDWRNSGMLVPLCPEIAAGFPTPRPPAEIEHGKLGPDVLSGEASIFENNGRDVSEQFVLGASLAVKTAHETGCRFALLADGSPSCGTTFVYSGHHDGKTRDGLGVVTAALLEHGIEVYSQHRIQELASRLR